MPLVVATVKGSGKWNQGRNSVWMGSSAVPDSSSFPPYWYSGAGVATIIWNGVLRRFSSARPLWQAPVPRTSGNRDARA